MRSRILFITRCLQPAHGGMQRYTRTLFEELKSRQDISLRVTGFAGKNVFLPFFFIRAFFSCLFFRGEYIHIGDAVLSPLLPLIWLFRPGIKRSITVFGLDLKYAPFFYQNILRFCLPFAGKTVAISRATAKEAENRGASAEAITVIPCPISGFPSGEKLMNKNDINLSEPKFLIFGRQIKRKGTVWFLQEVFPLVLEKYPEARLKIAGSGPEMNAIKDAAGNFGQANISILGDLAEHEKIEQFCANDIFLMPCIPVRNDMEGFGITCLEAAISGLPVVAAELEGVKDAVLAGETGFFFEPVNPASALEAIEKTLNYSWDPDKIREACMKNFSAGKIVDLYLTQVFEI